MITKLSIANFKSIRQLDIDCRKINLFIGEPNAGKSNIIETLALLSWWGQESRLDLHEYVRFQLMQDLFYDHLLDREILIEVARSRGPRTTLHVVFSNDHFEFHSQEGGPPIRILDYKGNYGQAATFGDTADIKFFRFKNLMERSEYAPGSLRPPDGANLFSVVFSSEVLREVVKEFFQKYGLRLFMKPHERSFELVKQVDDLFVSYPYVLTSDTLRRIIFYTIAIVSNRHSVLVFEEPESNAFPYIQST